MDLIGMLKEEVSKNSVNLIAQKTGESEERTQAGIFAAIPAVLAGIMKNGMSGGAGFLKGLLPDQAAGLPGAVPEDEAEQGETLLERGKSMLANLFGADTDSVAGAVSAESGIDSQKSAGLLAMAVPVIMGAVKRLMSRNGWSFSDLLSKLFENKSDIEAALPANLSSAFGLASLSMPEGIGGLKTPEMSSTRVPPVSIPTSDSVLHGSDKDPAVRAGKYEEPASSGTGFLKWLIPLILVALAAWWLLGRQDDKAEQVTDTETVDMGEDASTIAGAVTGSLNEAGDWVYDLGESMQRKLADGSELSIGQNSAENRLIGFIEDDSREVDKTTWFSLDRLYFDTGKSTLKPESKAQLENIAAIMKAYPDVKLKLGGYTDNTGDAAVNKRLSSDRALNAMKELTRMGVPASRIEAEGYGPEHPIASNDTKEGRAQNRRIDVRVTAK